MIAVLTLAVLLTSVASASKIEIVNNCQFPIWPGIQANNGVPENGGFRLNSGERRTIEVPDRWTAGRIWARTGCDDNFQCETGFCGNKLGCAPDGGEPPVSLAEFTLRSENNGDMDSYDVSLVDGFNIPVFIELIDGTYTSDGGEFSCKKAGGCTANPNEHCPDELAVKNSNGATVACKSACLAFGTDEYCCSPPDHNTPETCKLSDWPNIDYYKLFKDDCPSAYVYAFDEPSGSLFTCKGNGDVAADYRVQFC